MPFGLGIWFISTLRRSGSNVKGISHRVHGRRIKNVFGYEIRYEITYYMDVRFDVTYFLVVCRVLCAEVGGV